MYKIVDSFRQGFGRTANLLKDTVKIELLTPVKARVTYQASFPYEAFNTRGHINPWSVTKILEGTRILTWFKPLPGLTQTYMDYDKINLLYFIGSMTTLYQPQFYNTTVPKTKLVIEDEVTYLGRTSLTYNSEIFLNNSSSPIVNNSIQFITAHPETRKPSLLPDWFRNKYQKHIPEGGTPTKGPVLKIPQGVEVVEENFVVSSTQIDNYFHMNHNIYLLMFCETYARWHVRKWGVDGNGHPLRCVKAAYHNFKGEVGILEPLVVRMWPSVESADTFNFHLCDSKNDVIHHCIIEFFPENTISS